MSTENINEDKNGPIVRMSKGFFNNDKSNFYLAEGIVIL